MTERLIPLKKWGLHYMEIPQLIIRFIDDYESSKIKVNDEDFKRLFAQLKSKVEAFTALQRPITHHYDKRTLRQADKERDHDLRSFIMTVRMYRNSTRQSEKNAYEKLMVLTKHHKATTKRNYEEETFAISELLKRLKQEPYSSCVTTLGLTKFMNNLIETQASFETLFKAVHTQTTTKVRTEQINQARELLFEEYQRLCEYVDSMVWVKGSDTYKKILAIINKGRQFYIEVIHRRKGKEKNKKVTESPIDTEEVKEDSVETKDTLIEGGTLMDATEVTSNKEQSPTEEGIEQ